MKILKEWIHFDRLFSMLAGVLLCFVAGCPGHLGEEGLADKGVGKTAKEVSSAVRSKSTAAAEAIKEHNGEDVVLELAARIALLNGPATLEDIAEAKALVSATKEKWVKVHKEAEALGKKNGELLSKLDAALSKLEIMRQEAEQLRKDKQMEPFRRAMYGALLLLLYYAAVKKDPLQSTLCGTIAVFCGAAPWFYDSAAFGYLVWVVCIGLGAYAVVFFYDIFKTKLAAKHAVNIAEKLKSTTTPEETAAVLDEASKSVSGIAKAGIREARASLGLVEKEGTRLFSSIKKALT